MTEALADIVAFDLTLPEGWHGMPLREAAWPRELVTALAPGDRADQLETALGEAQRGVASFADPRMRAAAFVEFPETGTVSGVLAFGLVAISALGDPDVLEGTLRSEGSADGAEPYGVQSWQADVDAGRLVGAHYLLAHTELPEAVLEERVVLTVYPRDAAQAVQIVATASGLGAFPDMASAIQSIAATLRVEKASSA